MCTSRSDYQVAHAMLGAPAELGGTVLAAAETGYVDQSHLHRDAVAFAGVTPTAVAVAQWLAVDDIAWATREPTTSPLS